MALITNAIKGTLDLLPAESYKTQYVEAAVREIAENFGFYEMRTPVFEHTELFQRSVGETTDVVQKEMYTFSDKGGRSITLRPEGTAGAARAFLENGLFNAPLPQKIYYLTSCRQGGFANSTSSAWKRSARAHRRRTRKLSRWHTRCSGISA